MNEAPSRSWPLVRHAKTEVVNLSDEKRKLNGPRTGRLVGLAAASGGQTALMTYLAVAWSKWLADRAPELPFLNAVSWRAVFLILLFLAAALPYVALFGEVARKRE